MKGFAGVALAALVSIAAFSAAHADGFSYTLTPGPENPALGDVAQKIDFNDTLPANVDVFGNATVTTASGGPYGDATPYLQVWGQGDVSVSGDSLVNSDIAAVGMYIGSLGSMDYVIMDLSDGSDYTIPTPSPTGTFDPTSPLDSENLLVNLPTGVGVSDIYFYTGDNPIGADDVTFYNKLCPPVSAAPEPSTWALMILGVGIMGYALRKSSKTALVHEPEHDTSVAA